MMSTRSASRSACQLCRSSLSKSLAPLFPSHLLSSNEEKNGHAEYGTMAGYRLMHIFTCCYISRVPIYHIHISRSACITSIHSGSFYFVASNRCIRSPLSSPSHPTCSYPTGVVVLLVSTLDCSCSCQASHNGLQLVPEGRFDIGEGLCCV